MSQEYNAILDAYNEVLAARSDNFCYARGTHYRLTFALMMAGIDCKGLDSREIEGEAITYLERNGNGLSQNR